MTQVRSSSQGYYGHILNRTGNRLYNISVITSNKMRIDQSQWLQLLSGVNTRKFEAYLAPWYALLSCWFYALDVCVWQVHRISRSLPWVESSARIDFFAHNLFLCLFFVFGAGTGPSLHNRMDKAVGNERHVIGCFCPAIPFWNRDVGVYHRSE